MRVLNWTCAAIIACVALATHAFAQSYPSPVLQGETIRSLTGILYGNATSPVTSLGPILPAANGGLGAASLTGILVGNGSSAATTITPGTGVSTALGVNVESPGAFLVNGGGLGTPASGTLTNATGFPLANLAGAGSGVLVAAATATNATAGLVTYGGSFAGSFSGNYPSINAAGKGCWSSGGVPSSTTTVCSGEATLARGLSTPANPTAPASTSAYKMQGLAGSITPAKTGNIFVTISGTIVAPSGTTVNNGIAYQISYGTGTAPANAATLAGTQIGVVQKYTSAIAPTAAADVNVPFSITYGVTGLTVGTAYWVDLAAESITTASAMGLSNIAVVVAEQ